MRRALVLIAVAACSNAKPEEPAKRDAAPPRPIRGKQYTAHQTIHLDMPRIELPKQESFKLLDPGKGARAVLRYQLAPGTASYLVETKLVSRQLASGAWTKPLSLPPIRDGFAIAIESPGSAGARSDAKRRGESIEPGKPLALRGLAGTIAGNPTPEATQYLATWKQLLENRRLTIAFDARGQLGAIDFADDPTNARSARAKDELVQRMLASAVPLPVEPVGAGARWQVVTVLRQGSAYVKQTATYTLVARAKQWTIAVKLLRVGEEQDVTDPSLPKSATADLIALFRQLTGSVVVDPHRPLVVGGALAVESRLHVKITIPNRPVVEQVLEDTGSVTFSVQE